MWAYCADMLETNYLAVSSGIARGVGRGGSPRVAVRRGSKTGVIKRHQAWGQQNCSPPQTPITHTTPLAVPVSQLSRRCHLRSAHGGLFDVPESLISDVVPAVQYIRLFCERKLLHSPLKNYRHPFFQTNCKNIAVKPMNVKEYDNFFPVIS